MAASAAQIAQVRRMVAEPTTATYSDDAIAAYIEAHWLIDTNGREPYLTNNGLGSTVAPLINLLWVPTYDLNAAAADIWEEKAATLAANYDFNADGASHGLSQKHKQAMDQARYYRSRRRPGSIHQHVWPRTPAQEDTYIANLPETME